MNARFKGAKSFDVIFGVRFVVSFRVVSHSLTMLEGFRGSMTLSKGMILRKKLLKMADLKPF